MRRSKFNCAAKLQIFEERQKIIKEKFSQLIKSGRKSHFLNFDGQKKPSLLIKVKMEELR